MSSATLRNEKRSVVYGPLRVGAIVALFALVLTFPLDGVLAVIFRIPSLGILVADGIFPSPSQDLSNLKRYFSVVFFVDFFVYGSLMWCAVLFVRKLREKRPERDSWR